MDKQDKLLDKVSLKTNVSKNDILSLANDLSTKNLNDEESIKTEYDRYKCLDKYFHSEVGGVFC